jgi:hypothetical protein
MALFDFGLIRKTLEKVEDKISKLNQEIQQKKQEKEKLLRQPAPKSDVINMLNSFIDNHADEYKRRFSHMLQRYIDAPGKISNAESVFKHSALRLLSFTGKDPGISTDPLHDAQPNFFFIFRNQIKEGIKNAIDEMEWPEPGISINQRSGIIDRLDKEIKNLEFELRSVIKDARESGLDV